MTKKVIASVSLAAIGRVGDVQASHDVQAACIITWTACLVVAAGGMYICPAYRDRSGSLAEHIKPLGTLWGSPARYRLARGYSKVQLAAMPPR